jgi:Coenzyme PQQ synthesis protein D (PqqD)
MYKINSDKILFTQLGDEGVVYGIEKNEYITLNETFLKILQGIEQGKSEADIVATLCQEYNISEADCHKEVTKAIGQLLDKGYLSKVDE